jgi:arylsulfatase A
VGYFPDILPTLTELAGLPPPANTDGISLVPTLIGTPDRQKKHDYLYWELGMGRGWIAVRKGDWKAVLTPVTEPLRLGKPALFNLKDDIGESADIAEDHHDIVREMLVIMEQAHTSSEIYRFRLIPARRR